MQQKFMAVYNHELKILTMKYLKPKQTINPTP